MCWSWSIFPSRFRACKALSDVQLTVRRGSVHALMGENGAGKSTLMKVLIGMYIPEEGEITFQGKKVKIENTQQALKHGHLHDPSGTVAGAVHDRGREHLSGARAAGALWLIDKKKMIADTRALLERLEINIDPNTVMRKSERRQHADGRNRQGHFL
jgi:inositol transport system ATP-binding protein